MNMLMHRPKCLKDQKVEKRRRYGWRDLPEVFQRVLENERNRKKETAVQQELNGSQN